MSISKSEFNAAIAAAIAAVKPLLLQVESDVATVTTVTGAIAAVVALQADVAALHAELAHQVDIADALGSAGGVHTNAGGTGGKGNQS
jgi:hypothetical protein